MTPDEIANRLRAMARLREMIDAAGTVRERKQLAWRHRGLWLSVEKWVVMPTPQPRQS